MKRKSNKAIAALTLVIMTLTMILPMSANAAAPVTNPTGGTFTEADANDGTVTGTIDVDLDWEYYSDNISSIKGQLPSGLDLNTSKNGNDVKVTISGKAVNHKASDSKSITVTFRTRNWTLLWYSYKDESKTFNIIFNDPPEPPAQNNPGEGFERGKLRVLEVYPSNLTNNQVSGSSDPSKPAPELYNLLKTDSDYEVTYMSMNKFISLRDEINGNYDIVYFGEGTYNRNSIDETYFGNDITGLRAEKVLSFINSNQLCILHDDVFKGTSQDGTNGKDPVTIIASKFGAVKDRANVKVVKNAGEARNTISASYKDFNHRPILNVTDCPPSYIEGRQASHNLAFEYGVYDPDLLEDDATLTVELYIDRNCNSLFEETERIATRKIINGEFDTILFDLPVDYTGIYFWKLVATDTSMNEDGSIPLGAKAEKVDVFYVKGDEITINVLQIKPYADNNANLTDLFNTPVSGGKPGDTLGHKQGEFNIVVTEATVSEFNNGLASKHLRDLNAHYDMVILGFADNYSDDREFNTAAVAELQKFIDSKQSVMFTHDSIHFKYNTNLTTAFNGAVGQSARGGRGETAGLLGFSGSDPAGNTIESNLHGQYNSLNNTYKLANYQTVNPYPDTANLVRPVNSNTITLYPYNLESVDQNQRRVANTHYQWFKLDLEDENVIPLFNLYKDKSGERVNDDSMNNYYTYTKDNITYSGTGHASGYPDYEIKLFINTAIKAHAVANKKPLIDLIQPSENTVNITTPTIPLSFILNDDYDTQLDYWVDVDYDNDGNFERKIAEGVRAATNVLIDSYVLENRSTVGPFKIRIRAKEPRPTGAESVLIKELECVNVPVIKPTVTFEDQFGDPITSCLIGETIKINTTVKATGNLATEQKITPKYDIEAKYLDGTPVISKTNQNVGEFTFHPSDDPTPVGGITNSETVTLNPGAPTQLKVTAKAKYDAFGPPQEGAGTLNVNNGSVKIHVTDGVRNIKEVKISDGGTVVGQTGNAGTLTLNKLTGNHQYSIKDEDIPSGYVLNPGSVTVKRMSDGNVTTSDSVAAVALTGENHYWEVTIQLTLDLGIHSKYYRMKKSAGNWTASYLGPDGGSYYLRCPKGSTTRYLTRVEIDEIDALKVHGVKFELETLDKEGNLIDPADPANAASYARIINDPVTLTGLIPAELNPLNVKQLKDDNGSATVPADGTYAGKSYYLVIEIPDADLQKVKIKKITLTFEDATTAEFVPASSIIFGEPATPLLR